ncbi:MAG: YggS family pyridoxal phosphate-dependent enzyme [Pseudomonadales bacterium]|nr:YggS family pyridoxal phosphate-dependent enzyme [Pseudomonadales bacterium]
MIDIQHNINATHQRIKQASVQQGVEPPILLAISKTRPASDIVVAFEAGVRHFGENYLQEALEKIAALEGYPIEWHFTGPIQSNKTRAVAENFSWIHTLDRNKIARRLNEQRPEKLGKLKVCLQVNVDREESKSGLLPERVAELAEEVSLLPNLELKGLMAIPQAGAKDAPRKKSFQTLARMLAELKKIHPQMDVLSMGMSGDLELAIAEGATIVRVGTAVFGQRIKKP